MLLLIGSDSLSELPCSCSPPGYGATHAEQWQSLVSIANVKFPSGVAVTH